MRAGPSADDVLDAALRRATGTHWERLRLREVATEAGTTLAVLQQHFRDKEALVDALWDRADRAMLAAAEVKDLSGQTTAGRLETLLLAWLSPLAAHKRTAREMLLVRLEPGHLHIQLPSLFRLSRTVQWWREAAGLDAAFLARALEESALTLLFATTVLGWLQEDGDAHALEWLRRGLKGGEYLHDRLKPRD